MTLKRRFINEIYGGNYQMYLRERKADYHKVHFEWSCYIDSLCKNGEISQRKYDNATF